MASRGEEINAGLRSVKWRHLVMRVTFMRHRDLAMCCFFFDALKVLHKHHSTVVCFVYPGLKKFTTLHQAGCFRGAFYWVFRKVAVLGWSFIRAID